MTVVPEEGRHYRIRAASLRAFYGPDDTSLYTTWTVGKVVRCYRILDRNTAVFGDGSNLRILRFSVHPWSDYLRPLAPLEELAMAADRGD